MILLKNKIRVFNVFILSTIFYFQQLKITQITFPDSSNTDNVLTIKTTAFNE